MIIKKVRVLLVVAFIIAVATIGAVLWHNSASAQQPERPGRRFAVPETPAISAAGDYVYVVVRNTLYQFSAADLKLINKTSIETEPRRRPDRRDRMEEPFPPSRRTPEAEEGK